MPHACRYENNDLLYTCFDFCNHVLLHTFKLVVQNDCIFFKNSHVHVNCFVDINVLILTNVQRHARHVNCLARRDAFILCAQDAAALFVHHVVRYNKNRNNVIHRFVLYVLLHWCDHTVLQQR